MTRPLWKIAFDSIEPAVARPLEQLTSSSEFAVAVALARRTRRDAGRRAEAIGSWALHQAGLPSHRDLRQVQRQLGALERQLAALRRELDDRREEGRP